MVETPKIFTKNLQIIPFELHHFEAFFESSHHLAQLLDVIVPDDWPVGENDNILPTMLLPYIYLKENPDILGWWTYLFIHLRDRILVGHGGFKGKPNKKGSVEIGYAIVPSYQNRGLATEAMQGLISHAFYNPSIKIINAYTITTSSYSARILKKIGMNCTRSLLDPKGERNWEWILYREKYFNNF